MVSQHAARYLGVTRRVPPKKACVGAGDLWHHGRVTSVRPPNAEIVVVREALQGVMNEETAIGVMFEALRDYGRVPAASQVRDFVEGTLCKVLQRRFDDAESEAVLERLAALLEHVDQAPLELEITIEDDLSVTRTMPTAFKEPVSALVVAAGDGFAQCLRLSLGMAAPVTLRLVHDAETLRHDVFAKFPLLVVIDAGDPPGIAPGVLVHALKGLPNHIVSVVWAGSTPYGRDVQAAVDSDVRCIVLDKSDGLEPLLDLFLSRHQS